MPEDVSDSAGRFHQFEVFHNRCGELRVLDPDADAEWSEAVGPFSTRRRRIRVGMGPASVSALRRGRRVNRGATQVVS
jgi:hypothetical protein